MTITPGKRFLVLDAVNDEITTPVIVRSITVVNTDPLDTFAYTLQENGKTIFLTEMPASEIIIISFGGKGVRFTNLKVTVNPANKLRTTIHLA